MPKAMPDLIRGGPCPLGLPCGSDALGMVRHSLREEKALPKAMQDLIRGGPCPLGLPCGTNGFDMRPFSRQGEGIALRRCKHLIRGGPCPLGLPCGANGFEMRPFSRQAAARIPAQSCKINARICEKGSPNRASLVRCNHCNSHSAGDLAAAEAAGACVDVLGFAVHDGLDALHIGFPSAVRAAVRVAHFDAEAQALVAKLTFCHWLKHLLLYCLREQLSHNSRNPGRLQDDFHIFCAFSVPRPEKMPGTLQKPLPNAAALGTMGSGGAGAPPGRNNFAAAPAALPERRRARWAHRIIPSRCKRSLPSRG